MREITTEMDRDLFNMAQLRITNKTQYLLNLPSLAKKYSVPKNTFVQMIDAHQAERLRNKGWGIER